MRRRATILLPWLTFLVVIMLVASGPLPAPVWAFAPAGLAIYVAVPGYRKRKVRGLMPTPTHLDRMVALTLHTAFHLWRRGAAGDGALRRTTLKTICSTS